MLNESGLGKTVRLLFFVAQLSIYRNLLFTNLNINNVTNMTIKYRPDIDGLRAVAVLSVVIFHYFPTALPGGFVGVDIFFVISGYLITSIIRIDIINKSFSFIDFYKKRILRIFPALLLVLLFCLIYGYINLLPFEFKSLGKHIFSGSYFVSNITLWMESGYFDTSSAYKPLLHLWSLGIEEQFYLVWPIILIICSRARKGSEVASLSILIASLFYCIYTMSDNDGLNYYSPLSRCWELMAGALLSQVSTEFSSLKERKALCEIFSFVGISLILLSITFINEEMMFPGYLAILPVLGASLVIFSGPHTFINKNIISVKPFVFIGLISYPLYLWHWPLYSFARLQQGENIGLKTLLILFLLSFVLATLTYLLVEKNVRKLKRKGFAAIVLLVSVFTIGLFGGLKYLQTDVVNEAEMSDIDRFTSINDVYDYFDYKKLMRLNVCHSVSIDTSLKNGCVSSNQNQIFLFGDSYAAALYSGLHNYISKNNLPITISQMTEGNAPPFFLINKRGDTGRNLKVINSERIAEVARIKPRVLVMSWMVGGLNGINDKNEAIKELKVTIKSIKSVSPNTKVVVVGPVPEWDGGLIKNIIAYNKNMGRFPEDRMTWGLRRYIQPWDVFMKHEIPKSGAVYISAYDVFCNENGCLAKKGNDVDNIYAVDWGHLTKEGSEFLIERIFRKIEE
ncbi:acyltransferase family protein [Escherichia coli]|uniref:acyltransferase family protein n=2 Tax=Escherichia TaxID=561 RepID=UPI001FF109AC|nr:acyltransferase family protein [Escherichia coli]MCJ8409414.1 acyltransferase [Escherichia coli]MCS0663253.1 acyltransferase [Escherichia coli]MCS0834594.1 acyltransferase [Escherichia coli]